jgi:threonylcarbamoyladenosine tRNA methylthiotransferase MtaB
VSATVLSFGCRLNLVESEAVRALAGDAGDLVVVNTCSVTGEAVRQARQSIRRLKRERPEARIVVTGCAAQTEPQTFAAMPEVARVIGNAEKLRAESYIIGSVHPELVEGSVQDRAPSPDPTLRQAQGERSGRKVMVGDIMASREVAPVAVEGLSGHARAFVEVQNGCDHRCTFCVIPYGRGNSRSLPAGIVVDRIRRIVEAGFNEVVLTGVDITAWGADLPGRPSLGGLVQRILTLVPELPRLRLSSLDPVEIDAALLDALSDARLMPHLHLSLQAGDDMILKRMKRRHLRDDAIRLAREVRARRPEASFGADLIAGFPTESDAMFENSLALVDECDIVFGHIFPYSARTGTPAAKMPQLPMPVRRERAARLRVASRARLDAWLARQVGATQRVLVELDGVSGHGESFAAVRLSEPRPSRSIVEVIANDVVDGALVAA